MIKMRTQFHDRDNNSQETRFIKKGSAEVNFADYPDPLKLKADEASVW